MLKLNNILALSACLFGLVSVQAYSDADILNFALNLECLEAEFYSWAAFGKGLDETQRGGGPASVGGKKADLGEYQGIANEIATEEIKHVEFLRAALGAAAVPCPAIDIGPAFSAAADAALGKTLAPPFSPYENYLKFLHGALLFEDVGVMAYNGAVGVLTTPAYAAAARSIMAVEAYHAGVVRSQLSGEFNTVVAPYGATVGVITDAITTTIDALLDLQRKQSIGPSDGDTNVTPTDANALAYAVTPSAVLNVVYLSPTATKGGFFPKGINGLLGKTRGELTTKCEGAVAARYAQCGGTGYTGPMCCGKYDTCSKTSDGYSQCVPTNTLPKGVVAWYGQCGGKMYTGPKKCEPGSTCKALNDYYSQCTPN